MSAKIFFYISIDGWGLFGGGQEEAQSSNDSNATPQGQKGNAKYLVSTWAARAFLSCPHILLDVSYVVPTVFFLISGPISFFTMLCFRTPLAALKVKYVLCASVCGCVSGIPNLTPAKYLE